MARGRGDGDKKSGKKRVASRSASVRKDRCKVQRRGSKAPPKAKVLPKPIIPKKDLAEYRLLELPNKLRVLLVSTPQASNVDPDWTIKFAEYCVHNEFEGGEEHKSISKLPSYFPANYPSLHCGGSGGADSCARAFGQSAKPKFCLSMCIKAGSFADPLDFQGLAHYVEHVVHHGTETFPGEDSFNQFVRGHGGHTNAFTDKTCTNYHAVMNSGKNTIRECCQRYASMMTEPILDLGSITREIESVDNEYFMRKLCHGFRHNHLFHVVAIDDDEHPLHKFSIGSKEGLMNPNVCNSNSLLRAASIKFIQTHYFAKNMAIVIQAPEDLDFLEQAVMESFIKIPQETQHPDDDAHEGHEVLPYNMNKLNKFYTAVPSNMDGHTLFMVWALPPHFWECYKNKTLRYLETIFGHNSPGGLAHYLRQKGFIIALGVPSKGGIYRNEFETIFQIQFALTEIGREKVDEVILAAFSYIKLHKSRGPQAGIINQIQCADRLQLEKFELEKSFEQFVDLSLNMLIYDPSDIIVGETTPSGRFNCTKIKEAIDLLTPDQANFFLFTSDTNTEAYLTDEIYGIKYVVEPLEDPDLERFEDVEIYPEFCVMSRVNPFLQDADNDDDDEQQEEIITSKEVIANDKFSITSTPCAVMTSEQVSFTLLARLGICDLKARVNQPTFDVMGTMLKLTLYPQLFHQVEFGLRGGIAAIPFIPGSIAFTGRGLFGRGVTDTFLQAIDYFEGFPGNSNLQSFNIAKQAMLHYYFNVAAQPLYLIRDLSLRLKQADFLTAVESYDKLRSVTFEQFSTFVTNVKRAVYFDCQISGKIRRSDVVRLQDRLQNFNARVIPQLELNDILSDHRVFKSMPLGEKCLRMRSLVPSDKMFLVANEYRMGVENPLEFAMTLAIYSMLHARIHHQLRTVEQLGYVVSLDVMAEGPDICIILYVLAHSEKHSPCFIDYRIEAFLQRLYDCDLTIEKLSKIRGIHQILASNDPEPIRAHFQRYLLDNPQRAKVSLQVLPGVADYDCLCSAGPRCPPQGFICKSSQWQPPCTTIGDLKAGVTFATGRERDSKNYFISNIDEYHRQK